MDTRLRPKPTRSRNVKMDDRLIVYERQLRCPYGKSCFLLYVRDMDIVTKAARDLQDGVFGPQLDLSNNDTS